MKTGNSPAGLTRSLDSLSSHDLLTAGGKGASLGARLGAGLPVPEGFAVLTQAYRDFVDHNGFAEPVRRPVDEVTADDPAALAEAARALKERFLAGALPPQVSGAVAAAYADIGAGPVVVRSSATAEDLPGTSFAGQHDSFLNVEGPEDVADAVRGCWASLWNPRAVSYRKRMGLDTTEIGIAVVAQRMIDAERSGVLFTANPLDHRRDRMLLSASFGLGEAVEDGHGEGRGDGLRPPARGCRGRRCPARRGERSCTLEPSVHQPPGRHPPPLRRPSPARWTRAGPPGRR